MPANETTTPVNEDVVRTRAYLIWEADGRPFGRDEHYWHLAVSEITARGSAAAEKPKRAAASTGVTERSATPKAAGKKASGGKSKRK
jgi:hypothetical protein